MEVRIMGRRTSTAHEQTQVSGDSLDEIVTALLTASRVLVGVSARSLAGVEESVTLTQFRTLVVLQAHGATRLNRLAQRLGVNSSTALRSVDRMIASGLVDRRENDLDRREVVIELTRRGQHLVDDVTARRRQAIEEIVQAMPVAHRRQVIDALIAFAEAADEPVVVSDSATLLGW
jgi:DNA-binding MarR family transcriptional regulator